MPNQPLSYKSRLTLTDDLESSILTDGRYLTPDQRDGAVYVYGPELKLAVEVAMATDRPLLLRGEPGSGKSSLAAYIARNLNWRYYEFNVAARTRARDLLWTHDSIRRLKDAQVKSFTNAEPNDYDYIEPGVFWWVFDRETAKRRGAPSGKEPAVPAVEPNQAINETRSPYHAVLLIDEIDKADPDVPNDLLVPLGLLLFRVDETGTEVSRQNSMQSQNPENELTNLLIIITTNEERELPQAFLRRCVVHQLKHPDQDQLVKIAERQFQRVKKLTGHDLHLFELIAAEVQKYRNQAKESGARKPGTAEYLDAVRACLRLEIKTDSPEWQSIAAAVLRKHPQLEE